MSESTNKELISTYEAVANLEKQADRISDELAVKLKASEERLEEMGTKLKTEYGVNSIDELETLSQKKSELFKTTMVNLETTANSIQNTIASNQDLADSKISEFLKELYKVILELKNQMKGE